MDDSHTKTIGAGTAPSLLPPIVGYVTPLSGKPGESLEFKVSSQGNRQFSCKIVHIVSADPNPDGPGMKLFPVDVPLPETVAGREQPAHSGSCALGAIPAIEFGNTASAVVVECGVRPMLRHAAIQTVLSLQNGAGTSGVALALRDGMLVVIATQGAMQRELSSTIALPTGKWSRLRLVIHGDGQIGISVAATGGNISTASRDVHETLFAGATFQDERWDTICFAAMWRGHPQVCFDGLIESPGIWRDPAPTLDTVTDSPTRNALAQWSFAPTLDLERLPDLLDPTRWLTLVNMPNRAERSSCWTGKHMDWRNAPNEYAAIHFHSDDLFDCGWETSMTLQIPATLRSGVYGLQIDNGVGNDTIPFFVTPPADGPRSRILYIASTLTYLAYANHARGNYAGPLRERIEKWRGYPHNPDVVRAYGASTYNRHPDGAGISISSRLRPILTMRPGYLTFFDERGSGLRHFAADSCLTDWLYEKGWAFDVITDEDLDDQGAAVLAPYDVVLTGSHPEYHTREMLEALLTYQNGGGNLMYLGGNGFYWKIARPAAAPHALEIRRAEGGIRAWASEPGEYYHQFDGEYGGLWRRNGIAPQVVAGVGFTVQGNFEGSYYVRTPESLAPKVAWLFDGVVAKVGERIGDFGLSGGGAAGFELDQASPDLGWEDGLYVVAASENHGPSFQTTPEEILTWTLSAGTPRQYGGIRAHMVFGERATGGALFAVGSITFIGSLSHNGYNNDVSKILENCLRRFTGQKQMVHPSA